MFLPVLLLIILCFNKYALINSEKSPNTSDQQHISASENKMNSSFHRLGSKLNLDKKSSHVQPAESVPPPKTDFASLIEREIKKKSNEVEEYEETIDTEEEGTEGAFKLLKRKYEVPRVYARPVEKTLRILNQFPKNSYFHQHPDYYSLLGTSKSASGKQISQSYRKIAKALHPDKNPHPDAKKAFEAVAAANEKLSDPEARLAYDKVLEKKQRQYRSLRLVWKKKQVEMRNIHARLLLLWARIRRGEVAVEVTELKEKMEYFLSRIRKGLINFYYKIKFAPSLGDKSLVLGEEIWNQKFSMTTFLILLRLIFS